MHGLLFLVLIVGTAFQAEKKQEETPHLIQIIPVNAIITDGPTRGGGGPGATASPPPAAAPAPAPAPTPAAKPVEPEPEVSKPIEPPKHAPETKREEISELPVPKPNKTKTKPLPKADPISKPTPKPREIPDIGKPIVRSSTDKKAAADAAKRLADQKAEDRARGQQIAALNNSLNKLGQSLSSLSSGIESIGGSGGGGAAEINYRDLVFSKYDAAWTPPADIDDNEANTKVRVVIARSGKVVSSDITKASGHSALDKSVRRAIDSINFIAPFPESSKDSQRIYIINFNLKAKRGLG